MWKWIVLGLAFSSVLVLLVATPVWAGGIPVRFSGSWCVDFEDSQITVGPNFVEGRQLRCHIPQWVDMKGPAQVNGVLHDTIPGRPIIVLMECHHKFDKNFKKFKQGQIWALGDDGLSMTDMQSQKLLKVYYRCVEVDEDEDEIEQEVLVMPGLEEVK